MLQVIKFVFAGLVRMVLSYTFYKMCKFHKNRIVCISFNASSYSDNPRAVCEYMLNYTKQTFDYVWLIKSGCVHSHIPHDIKVVRYNLITYIYYLATSAYWISNTSIGAGMYKSKRHCYINTWHGDRGFKKILLDVPNHVILNYVYDAKHADAMVSGSSFFTRVIRSAFHYNGLIIDKGCPRNDRFFHDNSFLIKTLRQKYNLNDETRVLMYAPTFRNSLIHKNKCECSQIDLYDVLKTLNTYTNNHWKVFVRAHSLTPKLGISSHLCDDIISVTDYPEMNELLLITDVLVTDYSSSAGDFILLNKLVLLFQPDREQYKKQDRDWYFDIDDSPYICSTSSEEFLDKLKLIDTYDVEKNCKELKDFYGVQETGKACMYVSKFICDRYMLNS